MRTLRATIVQAYEQLTAAIKGGSNDPRVFYFRGLTYLHLGRGQEATQDFQKGSALEPRTSTGSTMCRRRWSACRERHASSWKSYRAKARMAAMEQTERLRKARYEAIQREEWRVLREQPPAPPESVATPEPAAKRPPSALPRQPPNLSWPIPSPHRRRS